MQKMHGLTLIELMVTVLVLAIVVGMAVPSFTSQIRNNQSLALGEEFITALNYARSEAVKRGRMVSICASNNDGDGCGSDWTNGWLVFLDGAAADTAPAAVLDDVGQVLRYWEPVGVNSIVTVTNGGTSRDFIRFTGAGMLGRLSNQPILANTRIDGCNGESARQIQVGLSGSVHSNRQNCP
jgi:type IV fimbrial biogenesis protein FimT